jgi:hypothetical protein
MNSTSRKNPFAAALSTLAAAGLSVALLGACTPKTEEGATTAMAPRFGQAEVSSSSVIVMAGPHGRGVVVVEQLSDKRECWSVNESTQPATVDPLLLKFNFSGICARSADSNGYSVRAGGVDQAPTYTLSLRHENGGLVLLGAKPLMPREPVFVVARAAGYSKTAWTRLTLEPGWRIAKRTYNGRTRGHFYFTNDRPSAELLTTRDGAGATGSTVRPRGTPTPTATSTPSGGEPFSDLAGDPYRNEVVRAAALGIVSQEEGQSEFRPSSALTREQSVVMAISLLKQLGTTIGSDTTGATPWKDVPASRWSAGTLTAAAKAGLVEGYEDGTFRPENPITRAELTILLRLAARLALSPSGKSLSDYSGKTIAFEDIGGHWAESAIKEMSAVCRVAGPSVGTGTTFAPDAHASRGYAAGAAVRLHDCLK